jgi:hypothetical protein
VALTAQRLGIAQALALYRMPEEDAGGRDVIRLACFQSSSSFLMNQTLTRCTAWWVEQFPVQGNSPKGMKWIPWRT